MNNRSYLGSITKYNRIGYGAESTVYHATYFDSDCAYKEYHSKEEYIKYIKPRLKKLSEFYNDYRFAFPNQFIYRHPDDEIFQGYVMNYLYDYKKIEDFIDLEYNEKIKIIKKARELLETFHKTYKHIHTDITPWNFLYNKEMDNVTLIDFDTCIDLKNISEEPKNLNILAETYLKYNKIDEGLDISMFNLLTYSILNNDKNIYNIINRIINNDFGLIESEKAIKILKPYEDITNPKTIKKEYVIDYLK